MGPGSVYAPHWAGGEAVSGRLAAEEKQQLAIRAGSCAACQKRCTVDNSKMCTVVINELEMFLELTFFYFQLLR